MSEIILKQNGNRFKLEVPKGNMTLTAINKHPVQRTTLHLDKPVILESINCTK